MSELMSEDPLPDSLDAPKILAWLKENPDFFRRHPEVLAHVHLGDGYKDKGGNIADFQTFLIERLQADKKAVLATTKEIVETSRANMSNQARIQRAVLRLLETRNLDEFLHALTIDISNILAVDISALVVEASGNEIPHIDYTGVRVVPAGIIEKWMGNRKILMQDDIAGIEAIYGGGAGLVRSQLLIALTIAEDTAPALMAFGSRDPCLFQDGLGTDHILFLGGVIERCLQTKLLL